MKFSRVNTDSRQAQAGDLFIALNGERFDGHEFLAEVAQKGAAAVLVEKGRGLSAVPDCVVIEAANPRHAHEWQLFETVKLPEGKMLIPGVIESKSNFVEHPELVAQRIGRYASLVGRENVMAGSDCGYGTWVGQAAVDPDVVWAKFAAMAEGARIASARFF